MMARSRSRRSNAVALAALVILVFLFSFLYRALSPKFTDDDFLFLARGQQILQYGELPCRDFLDEGRPLQYVASAAGQALFGYRLLGEVLVDVTLLSLGSALTVWLAARLSGSLTAGLLMGVLVTLLGPRLYNYPKYVLPVVGLALLWRYVDAKRGGALAAAALFTSFAFVFRHDFGGYLGVAGVVTIAAAHWPDGLGVASRRVARFAVIAIVGVLPLLVYLQVYEGVVRHFKTSWRFTNREFQREARPPRFTIDPTKPWLAIEPAGERPAPTIRVRWSASVDEARRFELERRYQIERARFEDGRTWEYGVRDVSRATLSALVRDEYVEDTHNIDRVSFRIVRTPAEPLGARLWRWIPLVRLRSPAVADPANAVAWLYYLALALPVMAVLVMVWRRVAGVVTTGATPNETAKILGLAALGGVSSYVLLRDSLQTSGRLADVGPPLGVLGAWLLVALLRVRPTSRFASRLTAWSRVIVVLIAALVTVASIVSVGGVDRRLQNIGLTNGWPRMVHQARLTWTEISVSPPIDGWVAQDAAGLRAALRYVRACTTAGDKLFVTWFAPQAHFYSGRGFAGGQPFFIRGFWARDDEQRATVDRMYAERVPIAIINASPYEGTTRAAVFETNFPAVAAYVDKRYQLVAESNFGGPADKVYRVLVDRRLTPSGTYPPLGLPCFR